LADPVSAKTLARPALTAALADLDAGRGSVLMVAKLDRLSRNVHDASVLLQRAQEAGWDLVALDDPVETTTTQGAAMAQVHAVCSGSRSVPPVSAAGYRAVCARPPSIMAMLYRPQHIPDGRPRS